MPGQSEVDDLVRKIRAQVDQSDPQKRKFKVIKSGKHQKVVRPNGQVVQDENGPFIISGSPGDFRFREMTVKRAMKAGIFAKDPYKAQTEADEKKSEKERAEEAAKERRARELRDRSEVFRVRTAQVRAAFEPIVAKLGGWSHGGSGLKVGDFVLVLQHWARANEPKLIPVQTGGGPEPQSAWASAVTNLRTPGGTIAERWLPLFESFVVALREGNENLPPEESALVYMDLLRAAKGILPPSHDEGPERVNGTMPAPAATPSTSRIVVEWPRVALQALFWMSRGADGQDRDEILDLAEEIAELAATNEERKRG